jgi:hypothetical protein
MKSTDKLIPRSPREGNHENFTSFTFIISDEPDDTLGQDMGLAPAWSSFHQQIGVDRSVYDSLLLGV